jgi:hypothetical protein
MASSQPWTASRNAAGVAAVDGGRREILFITSDVADGRTLPHGMRAGVELLRLDGGRDGLSQMAGWARTHRGYHAIHVISGGAEGRLALGSLTLDRGTAAARRSDLAVLGAALAAGGDLLLYGCEAATGEGLDFIAIMAEATGASVAMPGAVASLAELDEERHPDIGRGIAGTGIVPTAESAAVRPREAAAGAARRQHRGRRKTDRSARTSGSMIPAGLPAR